MSSDLLVLLLLVLVVLLGSALCSGVEAALLTVSPIRVHELAARERPVAGARRLAQLRQRLGRTLSALVIANNGFNIFGSLMLGGYAAWVFEQRNISGVALPVFSVGLTVLVILLGNPAQSPRKPSGPAGGPGQRTPVALARPGAAAAGAAAGTDAAGHHRRSGTQHQ